jgi:serine/threonine protein phosphatase PrpC
MAAGQEGRGTGGERRPRERDHVASRPASWVAGVCDRGIRHQRNEDALALTAQADPARAALSGDPVPPGRAVLVVCDGVTTSADSDIASLAAAQAACERLTNDLVNAGPVPPEPDTALATGDGDEAAVHDPVVAILTAGLEDAGLAAHQAVLSCTPTNGHRSPPSCTLVVAVLEAGVVAVGSVGDSRAYWIPDDGWPRQLTTDDSWAAERMAMGVPREEAETGHNAHAITRWLGGDSPDARPRGVWFRPDRAGWLLVCTDGLWNYRSDAADMARLVHDQGKGDEPLDLAEALVAWANAQGGHDNITVALARIAPPLGGDDVEERRSRVTTAPFPVRSSRP